MHTYIVMATITLVSIYHLIWLEYFSSDESGGRYWAKHNCTQSSLQSTQLSPEVPNLYAVLKINLGCK